MPSAFSLSAPILLNLSILSSILLKLRAILRPILRPALCGHAQPALKKHYFYFWALFSAQQKSHYFEH